MRKLALLGLVCGCSVGAFGAVAKKESPKLAEKTRAYLVEISIYPRQAELKGGKAQQALLVTAVYENGLELDVTGRAQFTIGPAGVIEITGESIALPLKEGRAQVKAAFGGKSATAELSVSRPAEQRAVSYLQHIAPILTQKGCTGSNCHGSVRGKSEFKLSLFGADPDLDYEEVVNGEEGRRINRGKPEESLLLQKPTFQVAHGGGVRFEAGSLEYNTILDWISNGLSYDTEGPELEQIRVHPAEQILVGDGSEHRLVVDGRFSDGSHTDLTRLVRYTSNDESIAAVDNHGIVTAKRQGATSIMIRTQGKVTVARIEVIPEVPPGPYPDVPAHNFIDEKVFSKLRRLNIAPSDLAGDSQFLRRIYLDTIGILPSVEETKRFLDSTDPQKRARLIDELLERPEFLDVWALKFADLFQAGHYGGVKGGWQFYRWIRQSLAEEQPYDEMVREMLLGGGSFVYDSTVNYFGALWVGPTGMVTKLSQSLLGLRMDCAQCHDHPFEQWTQNDYYGMAAFFTRLQFKAESYGLFERAIAVRPNGKPTYDYINNNQELLHPKTKEPVQPRFLTGKTVDLPPGEDPREELAEWVTSPDNPWFARAISNRIWKHFLGRGIVEPVDDFRVTNPPSNEALLDALANYLVREDFNLRALMKAILDSRTYQVSSIPNATNASDEINYSRYYVRRQIAEVLFDSMNQAAETRLKIPGYPPGTKALEVAVGAPNYFLMTFGKVPFRDQISERDHEPDVAQAMHLINGEIVNNLVKAEGNILDRVLGEPGWSEERRVEEIYLASLVRRPTEREWSECSSQLASAADEPARRNLYRDLFWAILNSKEFAYIY